MVLQSKEAEDEVSDTGLFIGDFQQQELAAAAACSGIVSARTALSRSRTYMIIQ